MPFMQREVSTFTKLVEIRKKMKIKQVDIAKHLGVTKSTLSRYENGTRDISSELQDKYAKYIGIQILLILNGVE